jgi:hypothetical protein
MNNPNTRYFPYPLDPKDGDVVFHKDIVCQYYAESNTWSCTRVTYSNTSEPDT